MSVLQQNNRGNPGIIAESLQLRAEAPAARMDPEPYSVRFLDAAGYGRQPGEL